MNKKNIEDVLSTPKPLSTLRLSFSRVSSFDRDGPSTLKKRKKLEGEFLDYGSIVDDIISEENINDKYVVSDVAKPTASSEQLLNRLLEKGIVDPSPDEVLEAIEELKLWKSVVKSATKVAKWTPSMNEYLKLKHQANNENKKLVSRELMMEAEEGAGIVLSHSHTRDVFDESMFDLVFQHEVKFIYGGFNFIGYIDIIKINHENKTIEPFDLKTGSGTIFEWRSSFIKYRYYLQYILYTISMKNVAKELGYSDYEILPFKFIFIGRTQKIPVIFNVNPIWNDAAVNGFTNNGYKYRGLNELLSTIDWHWENQIFNMPKELVENNGLLTIDTGKIEPN